MSNLLLDAMDAYAAEYVAEVQAGGFEPDGVPLAFGNRPVDDSNLGWGSDLVCRTDCDPNMTEVDGNSPEAVADYLVRMLSTPTGGLITDPELLIAVGEDPEWGFNLLDMLHVGMTEVEIAAAQDLAAAACRTDDRVSSATLTFDQVGDSEEFDVHLYAELTTGDVIDGVTFKLIRRLTDAQDLIDAEAKQ